MNNFSIFGKFINDDLKGLIYKIVNEYCSINKLNDLDIYIEFVDDLFKRRLELSTNMIDKTNVISQRDFIKTLNGTIVLPLDFKMHKSYILVSNNVINETYQFISTIIHELTHLYDFYNFQIYNHINDTCDIENSRLFREFYFWTEFHAKRNGYQYYRKTYLKLNNNNTNIQEQIKHIQDTECPFQIKILTEELIKYQNNPSIFIYNIIQFLGRFSVWNDLFPKYFNKNTMPNELLEAFDNRLLKLYEWLYCNTNFEIVKNKLDELTPLINSFIL